MLNKSEKVVFSGINQPITLSFANLNLAAVETIKNSKLYTNAAKVYPSVEKYEKLMLESIVTTNGWDTVSICRVTALNTVIKAKKTYPSSISHNIGKLSLSGDFDAWQVVTGGDGRNLKINVPIRSGTFIGRDPATDAPINFDLAKVSVDVYVKLNYFPLPDPKIANDGTYELYVNTQSKDKSDPIAAVVSLDDPSNKIDDTNQALLRLLFEKWLNMPENLKKFDTLFASVLINNMGKQSEEYKWLRATTISYAYTDKGTDDSSILGILCMTNNRSATGLPNQLPAVVLQKDDNAVFLISREVFLEYQLKPSLPFVFTDSPGAEYNLDKSGTTISAKNLTMNKVNVGGIDYSPVAEKFEICFDETYIRTTTKIHTNISPGIDAYSTITTTQTLALSTNKNKEQVMTYAMVGDPDIVNSTQLAPWVVLTEVIVALIASVIISIVGIVASKMVTLIVGIIIALVVAVVSIIIHVILEKAVAGAVMDALPPIEPMKKVVTAQIKWPFCAENAFELTDIYYSGAIALDGNLKPLPSYMIVNKKLVSTALDGNLEQLDSYKTVNKRHVSSARSA